MTQIYILLIVCMSYTHCDRSSEPHSMIPYKTESECAAKGLELLRSGAGMAGRAFMCLPATQNTN